MLCYPSPHGATFIWAGFFHNWLTIECLRRSWVWKRALIDDGEEEKASANILPWFDDGICKCLPLIYYSSTFTFILFWHLTWFSFLHFHFDLILVQERSGGGSMCAIHWRKLFKLDKNCEKLRIICWTIDKNEVKTVEKVEKVRGVKIRRRRGRTRVCNPSREQMSN